MATRAIPVPEYGPNTDYNAFTRYIELVNSGVPPFQALREAFPQGMMSPQERAKQLGKQQQSGALGQIAGMGVGLLGAKALQDALAGEKVLGGLREGLFGAEGTTGQGIGSRLADAFGFGGGGTPTTEVAQQVLDPRDAAGFIGGGNLAPSGISGVGPVADPTKYGEMLGGNATDITNFAGSATPYLGAAGTALGAYSALQGIRKKDPLSAGLGGLGAVTGLNMMGYALGPVGVAATIGVPLVAALAGKMGDKDRWKTEGKRLNKLRDAGINIPQMESDTLSRGRSKKELIAIEEQKAAQGLPSNVEFARTRDEKFLKPEDIWGYSTFFEKYGNDWLGKFTEQQRRDIAQQALNAGAVREHYGTIDIDWNKVDATPPAVQPQQQQKQKRK
jgi:hypothetical protein